VNRTIYDLLLFSFNLCMQFGGTIFARKDPTEFWKSVMQSQPMPEAIQGLIHQEARKDDYFVQNFDSDNWSPRRIYHGKPTETNNNIDPEITSKEEHFVKNFDFDNWSSRRIYHGNAPNETTINPIHPETSKIDHFVKDFDFDT
jgi:hypothetical protein